MEVEGLGARPSVPEPRPRMVLGTWVSEAAVTEENRE